MEPLKKYISHAVRTKFALTAFFIKYLRIADCWGWHKPVCLLCLQGANKRSEPPDQNNTPAPITAPRALNHPRARLRRCACVCVCVGMRTVSEQVHDTHPSVHPVAVVVTVSKTPMKHTSSSTWATENRPPDGECQSRASRRTRPSVVEVV